jgi:hypothetical protein
MGENEETPMKQTTATADRRKRARIWHAAQQATRNRQRIARELGSESEAAKLAWLREEALWDAAIPASGARH